ncbi:MAG TPA: hypothetical protein VG345_10945 [Bryobacteraceae bacterium]|nr:hypothetical protein [Bryobacteraceae bacterium]
MGGGPDAAPTYLFTSLFFRISRRAGLKDAAIAVAHRMLQAPCYIIRDRLPLSKAQTTSTAFTPSAQKGD